MGKLAHFPGTAKYQRMIETGRKLRRGKPLLSAKALKGSSLSLQGHYQLSWREFGFTSLLTNHFYNSGETKAGGPQSPELAREFLGEDHFATKLLSVLETSRSDSTTTKNLKGAAEDIALYGFLLGPILEGFGVGLRGAWNTPGAIRPSLDMAFTKNMNRLKGGFSIEDSFNIDDIFAGKYESIFEQFDKGLAEQLSLSNDDLRAIITIKNDLKPIVSKVSETLVEGVRLEALQARLARLNEINRTDISKETPSKSHTRPESGATQAEAGSPWREFTETNQRKPLWETPYSEQKDLRLKEEGKIEEEINNVEKEIAETESRLGEEAASLEETVVRTKESVTPPQKQSLVDQRFRKYL